MRIKLLLFSLLFLLGSSPATALTVPLVLDLEGGPSGAFAVVHVSEDAGDLAFHMKPGLDLGPWADFVEFYFNLVPSVTGLAIVADNAPNTPYTLAAGQFPVNDVIGGNGAVFDVGVNFGNTSKPAGNGILQEAWFKISADQDLTIADLLETTSYQGGPDDLIFAAHFRETPGGPPWLQTVGAPYASNPPTVPEPSAGVLGLLGLAFFGRRARR